MNYDIELDFLLSFFKNYHLDTYVYTKNDDISVCDRGFHQALHLETAYQEMLTFLKEKTHANSIYKITDEFMLIYYVLRLPNHKPDTFLTVGPYLNVLPSQSQLIEYMANNQIAPFFLKTIQNFFYTVPLIKDETAIQCILQTFAEKLWNAPKSFRFELVNYKISKPTPDIVWSAQIPPSEDTTFNLQALETYFSSENTLMQAVLQGNVEKAISALSKLNPAYLEHTADDSLPYFLLQTITLNTLLRKTAEMNATSTYQVGELSASYTQKLKYMTSPESCIKLQHEMIRKYCFIIQNYSIKNYSNIIQSVINFVDANLSADLSLRFLAKQLNVNASYLSNQFRKETGSTLTDYVNKKRIHHAIYLLNTTTLQIQTISQYCGINDVNYFTKLFKKHVQKSPSEYRKEIHKP